jgi:hydrogenase-4 component B
VLVFSFGLTQLAWPFVLSIALVTPAVALWSIRYGTRREFLLLALFVATMLGVLLARSVTAFFFSWELMALVSALLVATHRERRDVRRAAFSYLVMSQLGALCIIAAFALLADRAGSFAFGDLARAANALPAVTRWWVLALALVGFGSKAGVVPLHFWLPRAHPAAPGNASAVLSGLMLAVALYGFAQVALVFAAPVPAAFGFVVVVLGACGALLGGLLAAVERDVKRLLAFSSIENVGIILAALGLTALANTFGLAALAALALVAVNAHVISHALFKSMLFLVAGTLHETQHTTDLERLGGLFAALRFTAPLALAGIAAAAALPPTSGFASEWLVLQSFVHALAAGPFALRAFAAFALAALAGGSALASLAYVKMYGIGFLGESRAAKPATHERWDTAAFGLAWLALCIVVIGVAPQLVLGTLPAPPPGLLLAALPIAGAILALSASRGVRFVPAWTCGSVVTPRSQYTSSAFSHPAAIVFAPALRRIGDAWTRRVAFLVQRFSRVTRIVQGGLLRVYLTYAVIALALVLVFAR